MGSVLFCNIGVKDRVSWAVYCTMKFGAKDEDNCFLDPNWLASMVATVLKVGILMGLGYLYNMQCAVLQHTGRRWGQLGSLLPWDMWADRLGWVCFPDPKWLPSMLATVLKVGVLM